MSTATLNFEYKNHAIDILDNGSGQFLIRIDHGLTAVLRHDNVCGPPVARAQMWIDHFCNPIVTRADTWRRNEQPN